MRRLTKKEKLSLDDAIKTVLLGSVLIWFITRASPLLSQEARTMAGRGASENLVTGISVGLAFLLFVMTFVSVRIIIRAVYGRFG